MVSSTFPASKRSSRRRNAHQTMTPRRASMPHLGRDRAAAGSTRLPPGIPRSHKPWNEQARPSPRRAAVRSIAPSRGNKRHRRLTLSRLPGCTYRCTEGRLVARLPGLPVPVEVALSLVVPGLQSPETGSGNDKRVRSMRGAFRRALDTSEPSSDFLRCVAWK